MIIKFNRMLLVSGVTASLISFGSLQAQTDDDPPAEEAAPVEVPAEAPVDESPAEEAPTETPAPETSTAPDEPTPVPATSTGDTANHGLLGPLRIGPTASIGFPFLLNYSLDATWDKTIGMSFSGGRFQRELDKETEIELFNWDVRARWFPFQGSFFLGAAYGNQGIVAKTKQDLKVKTAEVELTVPTTMRLELNTNYLTPHLGWFKTWGPGFTIGSEIGYQMPLSSKAELQTGFEDVSAEAETTVKNSDEYKKAKKDLETSAEAFGKNAVPYLNLIRIGWLF